MWNYAWHILIEGNSVNAKEYYIRSNEAFVFFVFKLKAKLIPGSRQIDR